jgi:[acyl-carrier-protein] S-malonyltransferase
MTEHNNLAYVFPGQGSQHIKMGKDIFDNFKTAGLILEEASDTLDINMKKLILGDDESLLNLTENTQPAILTVSVAILNVIKEEFDISASVACTSGHSLGEYSSNVFGGSIDFRHALLITRKRGELMQSACPVGFGKMAAIIGLTADVINATINELKNEVNGKNTGDVYIANYNCIAQTVISGEANAIDKTCSLLKTKGAKKIVYLPVSAPFHTPYMEKAEKELRSFFKEEWFDDTNVDIISNVTGLNYSKKEDVINLLLKQVANPVKWIDCVSNMKRLYNVNVFIEIGPSNVLNGLIKRIAKDSIAFSVNSIETLKDLGKSLVN